MDHDKLYLTHKTTHLYGFAIHISLALTPYSNYGTQSFHIITTNDEGLLYFSYIFKAPEVNPATKYFIAKVKSTAKGIEAITYPAKSGPHNSRPLYIL